MDTVNSAIKVYFLALIYLFSIVYLVYVPEQNDFLKIIIPYSICFGSYLLLYRSKDSFNIILSLCIISRVVLIFAFPKLSDDIIRFIWDGRLIHAGISPYQSLPVEIVGKISSLDTSLFNQLNSPEYYSLYPPIAQLFNYISTTVQTPTLIGESIIYKSLLFLCDLALIKGILTLLKEHSLPQKRLFLYALNPLIIIEHMGNIHFEGVMILFLCMSLLYLKRDKILSAGSTLSLAIASKMLPLMFSIAYLFSLSNKRIKLVLYSILSSIILFAPILLTSDLINITDSLDLYVKKFEFNGSIYYLLRAIGYQLYGFNTIHIWGPILSIFTILSIAYISYKKSYTTPLSIFHVLLICFSIFLFTSRTVHPWYLSMAIFLCSFTRFRFPILWSYLIFWTYINYSYTEYHENLWIVAIQYILVIGYIIYEVKGTKKAPIQTIEA